jgi:hypothetical protein
VLIIGDGGLSVDANSSLDLTDNALVLNYTAPAASPAAAVEAQVRAAFGSGSWTGTGITSSTAAASAAENGR